MSNVIVVAEDDADIRNNLVRMLRMEGFTVHAAPNGREGLALVQLHTPDMVLSDVTMPEMTGHELVRSMRAAPALAQIPVVLLTARADRSDVREGMNLGADDYLTKPFQRDELLTCIRVQLDKSEFRQMAAKRQLAQAEHLSHFDKVTNLPNRTHFLVLLTDALVQARLQGSRAGLLLASVALENLSHVAEVLGTSSMDACVNALGRRLALLAESKLGPRAARYAVARLSFDRFALYALHGEAGEDSESLARILLTDMGLPIQLSEQELFPTVAVGVCTLLRDEDNAESLLARAEIAVTNAGGKAGLKYTVLNEDSDPDFSATFRLHNDLHRAAERQELMAYFQPQVASIDGTVQGFEALMRWNHATLGLISPVRFIPLAENNGQIVSMGAWILREACLQAKGWESATNTDARPLRVAVNLSMRQFMDPALESQIRAALEESGLQPGQLELEVTESTAMCDMERTLALLRRFKAMGLLLAIDDFGTGYSSLSYLKRFPLDVLKIDQSFVRNLCTDKDDLAIVQAITSLAHSLGLSLIAEGVETVEQEAILKEMGCQEIQGYLHAKPMPPDEVMKWLATRFA
jgi:EAL domain-containing protein (putative c-di-GMP-specific phosphodiesterase class I)/FixJ family two-component response regulator